MSNCQKWLLIDVFKDRYSHTSLPKLLFSLQHADKSKAYRRRAADGERATMAKTIFMEYIFHNCRVSLTLCLDTFNSLSQSSIYWPAPEASLDYSLANALTLFLFSQPGKWGFTCGLRC